MEFTKQHLSYLSTVRKGSGQSGKLVRMTKREIQGGLRVIAQMILPVALTYQMKQVLLTGSGLKFIFHSAKGKDKALQGQ